MTKVSIIGTGNVSYHLERAFAQATDLLEVQVLPSRSDFSNRSSEKNNGDFDSDSDLVIIAVSDDAIATVSKKLQNTSQLVVHTSGSVPMNALERERRGVFYPLQTFSKNRDVDFGVIPICIEANEKKDLKLLRMLGEVISRKVHEIDSEQRKALHLAAVFVNNFSNHLYQIGNRICQENDVSFDLLKPLIAETASKIETLDPLEAQTGPAKRNDVKTIGNHLTELKSQKLKEVYLLLTRSIQDTHGKKL